VAFIQHGPGPAFPLLPAGPRPVLNHYPPRTPAAPLDLASPEPALDAGSSAASRELSGPPPRQRRETRA